MSPQKHECGPQDGQVDLPIFTGPLTRPWCWARPCAVHKRHQPPGSRPWEVTPARSSQTCFLQDGSSYKRRHLHGTCHRADGRILFRDYCTSGLPGWLRGKESACQCRRCTRPGSNPWVGKIPWRKKWQPTPVCLPGKSHGQRSLVGYYPRGHKSVRHDLVTKRGRNLPTLSSEYNQEKWERIAKEQGVGV